MTESQWRRAVLLALPIAALAFLLGVLLDVPSGQSTPFDQWVYPALAIGLMLIELLLWRCPLATNQLLTALVISMSVFFLGKLVYILNLMPSTLSIQSEMTETFFWMPALYVLSFFIPDLRLARPTAVVFFTGVLLISGVYTAQHGLTGSSTGVVFALGELNLANLTLLALTSTFVGFNERLVRSEAQAETLQQLAYADLLTGLSNRLHLDLLLRQAEEQGQPFSLLFIDLDEFKLVNDTLGHAAGDDVLQDVARRLKMHLHPGDAAVRLGGDEFVVLLREPHRQPTVDRWPATEVADALLVELTRPYLTRGQVFHLTASVGVSSFPEDAQDGSVLLRHADSAMYAVKSSSRNGVQRFEASLGEQIEWQKTLERDFRFALERDQLHLVYQPIYDLGSGDLRKVEALLRWTHPAFGAISPTVFVPLAEANGQIIPVGQWVLQEACRQARAWQPLSTPPLVVCVNVSPIQLIQPGFVMSVRQALAQHDLTSMQLELELTEGAVMRNLPAVQAVLLELRQLGVKVAVDDFGTGYSSLAYLKDLPITCIKIDRSFVADLGMSTSASQYALALVEAVVGIARTLDLQLVAEGIETGGQQTLLRELGCQFGQGYLYSPPVDTTAIAALLIDGVGTPHSDHDWPLYPG